MYKKLSKPGGPLHDSNNISLVFNTDGMPVFQSTNFSVWPIHVMINELPPNMRNKHMMVGGIWYGKKEPNMSIFLLQFVNEVNYLSSEGIKRKKADGSIVECKVFALCSCVDSAARPIMLNAKKFNGYYGCSFCYHPGEIVGRTIKYTVQEAEPKERIHKEVVSHMNEALQTGKPVFGLKGPSPLMNIDTFDLVWGCPPDHMHSVFLGVSRQLTGYWLDNVQEPYYIGSPNFLRTIDNYLSHIKPPKCIARLPRTITQRNYWKAVEWRNWLLFYSGPCLRDILPGDYFKHYMLLIEAIYILLQGSISLANLQHAEILLTEFVIDMQSLYSKTEMTFNVHLLEHLCKSVALWGPLWTHSAFEFENENGIMKKLVKGTRGVPMQIIQKCLLKKVLPHFEKHYNVKDNISKASKELLLNGKVQSESIYHLGKGKVIAKIDHAILHDIETLPATCTSYKRMVINGEMISISDYAKFFKTNDSFVILRDGKLGQVLYILSATSVLGGTYFLVLKEIQKVATPFISLNENLLACIKHIEKCAFTMNILYVPVEEMLNKCIMLAAEEPEFFLSQFPNKVKRN